MPKKRSPQTNEELLDMDRAVPPKRKGDVGLIHRRTRAGGDIHGAVIPINGAALDVYVDPAKVREWDDDELLEGRRKNAKGKFVGQKPHVVPMACLNESNRRRLINAQEALSKGLLEAVDTLIKIAKDPNAEHKDRIKASNIIIDRVMGKPKETIEIEGYKPEPKFVGVLGTSIVNIPEDQIIDAEVIEDEDDDLIIEDEDEDEDG